MVKVLIAGPPAVRQSIKRKLELASDNVRVVAESPTVRGAVLLTRRFAPNLVFVADDSGTEDEAAVTEAIRRATPQRVQIVLIPPHPSHVTTEGTIVLPRSQYTQRAMLSAMGRCINRLSA